MGNSDSVPVDGKYIAKKVIKKKNKQNYEEEYKKVQEKLVKENLKRMAEKRESLSGRKTVVGASSGFGKSFSESKSTIKEYLNKAGVRL